jgi:hypothetical protein
MAGESRAYVGGFNLYCSLLQANPPLKWLELPSLWEQVLEAQFPAVLTLPSGRELHRPREWV